VRTGTFLLEGGDVDTSIGAPRHEAASRALSPPPILWHESCETKRNGYLWSAMRVNGGKSFDSTQTQRVVGFSESTPAGGEV
jgi:hypothetical protein